MPLFIAKYLYDQPAEAREAARGPHRDYLRDLASKGSVIAAGPMADGENGFVLYRTDSLEQANALLQNDPYLTLGGASSKGPREWDVVITSDDFPAV